MMFLDNMIPVGFWPYTSIVTDRFIELKYTNHDSVDQFQRELVDLFNAAGIKAERDNKVVFELYDTLSGRLVYLGFYDLRFHVGHDFRTDSWNLKKERVAERDARIAKAKEGR